MTKPKIRTITAFIDHEHLDSHGDFVKSSNKFEDEGYKVRTRRVSFANRHWSAESAVETSRKIESMGVWGFSSTFQDPLDESQIESASAIIQNSDNGFVNFELVGDDWTLDTNHIEPISKFISNVASGNGGINNFRVGVSSCLKSPTPFFPYSSNKRGESFAVGLEYVDNLLKIIRANSRNSLGTIREAIKNELKSICADIYKICKDISEDSGLEFLGIDLSLAPFPYPLEDQSVVEVIEELGNLARSRGDPIFRFGMSGTLFFHTFLTRIIKEVANEMDSPTTGFNGIMYSVLEDSRLGQRFADGTCGISDLLLTSTTCGCGIDMLPIVSRGSTKLIGGFLLDLFSLSSVLQKPLGLRVLPIPGSRSGDWTRFKHLFFTNTVIVDAGTGISVHQLPSQVNDSHFKF